MKTLHTFEVWAPEKERVELILDGRELPMKQGMHGHWLVEAEVDPATARYRFRVDGEGPFPDPRSQWQPDGVHGDSCLVDHSHFAWNDHAFAPKPLDQAVLYELHVGTFSPEGTYEGVRRRLEHLVQLGVTHVEIMPLHAYPGVRGWGYDGAALYAPHAAYGTPDELKGLVQHAHNLGLAVLLDVVYNHFGPDGTYAGAFAPYHTNHYKTPWGDAINYDDRHAYGVREFVIGNALMWLRDYHFDGLRLDAVHAIHDESAVHILEELSSRVRLLGEHTGKHHALVAESDLNSPHVAQPRAFGGFGLDAHWADDFHHALHAYFTGERDGIHLDFGSLANVAKALRQAYVYDGQFSEYRQRYFGRTPSHLTPASLVVFSQNHDQTGNRAQGERLVNLLDAGKARAIAALVLFSPFVPLLFQGEEWGATSPFLYFSDHETKLGKLVAEGRRKDFEKFGWAGDDIPDPQVHATFEASQLRWSELEQEEHRAMLGWYQQLVALRAKLPAGEIDVHFDEEAAWLTARRGDYILALNLAGASQRVPLPEGEWTLCIASEGVEGLYDAIPAAGTFVARRDGVV